MSWFVKQRVPSSHAMALGVAVVLTLLLGDLPFPVPNLGLGPAPRISMSMFLPSVTACATGAVTALGSQREAIARRPLGIIDTTWSVALAAATTLPHLFVLLTGAATGGAEAARNTVGFLGVGLLARRCLRGVAVTAAPTLVAMVSAVLSSTTSNAIVAWPYRPADDLRALAVAVGLWATGLVVGTGRRALRVSSTHESPGV
jgi:hypothetical protein